MIRWNAAPGHWPGGCGAVPGGLRAHYVFVGYFGCRPYHNLAAYCHLSRTVPGLEPKNVTDAYFEGIDSPEEITALRAGKVRQLTGAAMLLRELRDVGPRLRALEEQVAELEWGVRAAMTVHNPIALFGVLRGAVWHPGSASAP